MTEMVARLAPGGDAGAGAHRGGRRVRSPAGPPPRGRTIRGRTTASSCSRSRRRWGERARLTLWLLVGAAAFVMLIAAANVANLTLMRGVHRQHELVLRAALGAGVSRLRRLVFMEHLVLTISGAMLGVAMAVGGLGLLVSLVARYSPRASEIRLRLGGARLRVGAVGDGRAHPLPPRGAAEGRGAHRTPGGRGAARERDTGTAAPAAGARRGAGRRLSVVLLAGARAAHAHHHAAGRRQHRAANRGSADDPGPAPQSSQGRAASWTWPTRRCTRACNVRFAPSPGWWRWGWVPRCRCVARCSTSTSRASSNRSQQARPPPHAELRTASPEYFRAAGIPLRRGREFNATDRAGATRVVIVNQTLADRFFPGADPIGKRIAYTGEVLPFTPFSDAWRTIVGVVANTQDGGLDAEPRAVAFAPFAQEFSMLGGLVIRADSNASGLADAATRIVRSIAPAVAIENVLTVAADQGAERGRRAGSMRRWCRRSACWRCSLPASAIAGVLAFSVSARTHEIGDSHEPRRQRRPGATPDPARRGDAAGVGAGRWRDRRVDHRGA
jgi:putative ABC transport system permease protein